MADVDDNDAVTHAAIVVATDVIKMRMIMPRIHDNEDGMIILQSLLCSRHQAFLVLYHELLCGIPLMHNDEDGTIILQSLCLQHQNAFVVYHDLLLGNTNARWTEGNHYVARIHTRFLILLYDDE